MVESLHEGVPGATWFGSTGLIFRGITNTRTVNLLPCHRCGKVSIDKVAFIILV